MARKRAQQDGKMVTHDINGRCSRWISDLLDLLAKNSAECTRRSGEKDKESGPRDRRPEGTDQTNCIGSEKTGKQLLKSKPKQIRLRPDGTIERNQSENATGGNGTIKRESNRAFETKKIDPDNISQQINLLEKDFPIQSQEIAKIRKTTKKLAQLNMELEKIIST